MRKIDKVTDFDGKEWKLFDSEIEEEFYRRILNWRDPFIHLTDENVQNKFNVYRELSNDEKVLLRAARIFKKRYVLAKPFEIQSYADRIHNDIRYANLFYVNSASTDFTKAINEILNYDGFRDAVTKGIWLAKTLNIKTCPYCNSQYTLVVKQGETKKAKFQFDHFFPKSRYPIFSLSLYNLIPSCASCNLSKKETDFNLTDFVHPYVDSFATEFKIKLTLNSEKNVL